MLVFRLAPESKNFIQIGLHQGYKLQRNNFKNKVDTKKIYLIEEMSSSEAVRESAKRMVRIIEKLPDERIKHFVSFKGSQAERFRRVAGLQSVDKKKKAPLEDIKDIITRTSGPLGLQKDLLKKVQSIFPKEELNEQSMQEQIKALSNISNNKFRRYYDVGEKLYRPAGNPTYYQRIIDEIEGKQKETFFSAFRTVMFGR